MARFALGPQKMQSPSVDLASTQTITGFKLFIRPAESGVAEPIAVWGTSDMLANSGLFLDNGWGSNGVFAAALESRTTGSSTPPALLLSGQVLSSGSGSDSGAVPIVIIRGRRGDGSASTTRPSIAFNNGTATMAHFTPGGSFSMRVAGQGFQVAEGANAKQGVATLVAGTVTVANTSVTANSRIFLTAQDNNTTGALRVSARTAGTSFVITSNNAGDSGVVAYEIFEPA